MQRPHTHDRRRNRLAPDGQRELRSAWRWESVRDPLKQRPGACAPCLFWMTQSIFSAWSRFAVVKGSGRERGGSGRSCRGPDRISGSTRSFLKRVLQICNVVFGRSARIIRGSSGQEIIEPGVSVSQSPLTRPLCLRNVLGDPDSGRGLQRQPRDKTSL